MAGSLAEATRLLDQEGDDLAPEERACLQVRWVDQRAYQKNNPPVGERPDIRAYGRYKLGDRAAAVELAEAAIRHAGDGGYIRLRAMALNLLARILGAEEGRRRAGGRSRSRRGLRTRSCSGGLSGGGGPRADAGSASYGRLPDLMAIHTNSELEVVLRDIILRVDRTLHERYCTPLEAAVRDLRMIALLIKRNEKLNQQHIRSLLSASVAVRDNLNSDDVFDRMLDIEDYIQGMK